MEHRRVSSVGIMVGCHPEFCTVVTAGETTIYIHGTPAEIAAFGQDIINEARRDTKRYEADLAAKEADRLAKQVFESHEKKQAKASLLPLYVTEDVTEDGTAYA